MIRIIFSFVIVVVLSPLKPLLDNPSSPYIQYSSIIQEGESYILDNELSKALKSYDKALHLIEKPLASDCFTALQVAAFLKKNIKFGKFLEKGFATGLVPKDLSKDSLLNSFVEQNQLDTMVQETYGEYESTYSQNINKFLSDTISKISAYDNKWKVFYLDSLRSIDKNYAKLYDDKYDSIVNRLVEEKLIPLISKYGYPGERKIGIGRVALKSEPYDYAFVENAAFFVLLHYYRRPKGCKYNTLFYDEVKKGNLKPEYYATIIDYQVKYGGKLNCNLLPYNEWRISENTEIEKINLKRAEIGLGKFELIKKKYDRGMDICYETDKGNYKHIKLFYWCG